MFLIYFYHTFTIFIHFHRFIANDTGLSMTTFGPSGPGDPRLPLDPGRPLGPGCPLSPGLPRSP